MVQTMRLIFVLLILVTSTLLSQSDPNELPNATLEIAAQQKSDGQLSKSVFIFQFECNNGECTLITVGINQCWGEGADRMFPVSIQKSSTSDGALKVKRNKDKLEIIEHVSSLMDDDVEMHYLIGYEYDKKYNYASKVTSFSGGFTKKSNILDKILTVEFIPLKEKLNYYKLDTQTVLLPGISK